MSTVPTRRADTPPDFECLDAEQVLPAERARALAEGNQPAALLAYLLLGGYLGVLFIQSEVVSWFRIQEMFRFQSVHMYGIIGTAVGVALISIQIITRWNIRTLHGEHIQLESKAWGRSGFLGVRYWAGGTLFGMGWALVGACPGPMFALVGTGMTSMLIAVIGALLGTWTYALVQHRLPH